MTRATILVIALTLSACADTLTFRNGTAVTGTWLGIDSDQIKFQVNDEIKVYPRSDVTAVAFGEPETLPPPIRPPAPSTGAPAPAVVNSLQEPENIGAVYYRDPTRKLIPLERLQAIPRSHRRFGTKLTMKWTAPRPRFA